MSAPTARVETPDGLPAERAPAAYGSDAVVDLLAALDVPYLPMNPGSSFRGLHDSLVNHGGNPDPRLLLCLHEEVAVSMAHGWSKATGRLGVAAVHDLVGLMHGSMAVYDAFCDRTPLLLLGGSGPADPAQRRPIDWIHSATTQAQLVRDFTVWDAEPTAARVRDRRRAGRAAGDVRPARPGLRESGRRGAGRGAARRARAAARPGPPRPRPAHGRRPGLARPRRPNCSPAPSRPVSSPAASVDPARTAVSPSWSSCSAPATATTATPSCCRPAPAELHRRPDGWFDAPTSSSPMDVVDVSARCAARPRAAADE